MNGVAPGMYPMILLGGITCLGGASKLCRGDEKASDDDDDSAHTGGDGQRDGANFL